MTQHHPVWRFCHQRADCRELWHSATMDILSSALQFCCTYITCTPTIFPAPHTLRAYGDSLIISILVLCVYYMYSYHISCATYIAWMLYRYGCCVCTSVSASEIFSATMEKNVKASAVGWNCATVNIVCHGHKSALEWFRVVYFMIACSVLYFLISCRVCLIVRWMISWM